MSVDSPDLSNFPFHDVHEVPLAAPYFDDAEVEAAAEVVRSGYLCQGPKTAEFEKAFAAKIGVGHAIAVSSGSTALLVALQAMGVGQDDEVIVPNMTFISTATAAMYLGARPVLCDITATDYNLDVSRVEQLVTKKTKVILPVHYAGSTADMDPLQDIASRHGLQILEDAAEAHLAEYKDQGYSGTIGDMGIFSFTPTKPMTTGEGGMIVTNRDDLAEQCRIIRNFGDRQKFAWAQLGFNFRITEVSSAIGLCQLAKLDEIISRRREKARRYDEGFADEPAIVIPWVRSVQNTNYQLYTVRLNLDLLSVGRDAVMEELAAMGVSSRLYYPALHKKEVFASCGDWKDEDFPNSLEFEKTAISLPIFTSMTSEQVEYVIKSLLHIVRSKSKTK